MPAILNTIIELSVQLGGRENFFFEALQRLFFRVRESLCDPLEQELGQGAMPPAASAFLLMVELQWQLWRKNPIPWDIVDPAVLKRAVLEARLAQAAYIEDTRSKLSDPQHIQRVEETLEPYRNVMQMPWFSATDAVRVPKVTDYLTIERAEKLLERTHVPVARIFDEKFHILYSPALCIPDLDYYRAKCGMRDRPVAVAFMDIDDFKQFNTMHGETHVDLYVLRRFMAALESHIFAKGLAYRFGGDEYVIVLPNVDESSVLSLLIGFQEKLKVIEYTGVPTRTTVSIGFAMIDPDSASTSRETLHRAEQAKNHAKRSGKNAVAVYRDTEAGPVIASPAPAKQ